MIRLADIIKEREVSKAGETKAEAKASSANGKDEKKESAKSADGKAKTEPEERDPQVEEAVEVLADLVALSTHRGPGAEAVARGGQ